MVLYQGVDMNILKLTLGGIFTYLGVTNISADSPNMVGWLLLVIGVVLLLSFIPLSKSSRSGSDSGFSFSSWSDSDGGGGGCDGGGGGGGE